ncbi:hypothetical protein PC121_g22670, partial [Phytophthora cactorum]
MATAPWSCSRCTFENEAPVGQCAMCLSARPLTMPSPSSHSVKKVKAKTPPQSQSSLLFSVGSSAEKEQQRIQKKLQQLKEL